MKRFITILLAGLLFAACGGKDHAKKTEIKAETDSLMAAYHYSDSLYALCGRIDTAAFSDFITRAMAFAEAHPQDTLAPGMLYRAGVGSMILAKSAETAEYRATNAKRALAIFNQFQEQFPEHPSSMTTSSATGAARKSNTATSSTASPTTPSRPSSNNISPSSGNRNRKFPQCTMYNEQCTS